MIEFGERLKSARESHGMTQQSLADKLFVTKQTVSRWERGDRFPDLIMTKKISTILDISIDSLMADTELSTVVEKSSIIDNSVLKKIILILYAFISVGFIYTVVYSFTEIDLSIRSLLYIIDAIIFITGFTLIIKVNLIPRNAGIICASFYAISSLSTIISSIESMNDNINIFINHELLLSLVLIVTKILLLIGSIEFFCKNKHTKLWSTLMITIISISYAITLLFLLLFALVFAEEKTVFIVSELPEILIPILIIIEIVLLNKRRKLAISESFSLG